MICAEPADPYDNERRSPHQVDHDTRFWWILAAIVVEVFTCAPAIAYLLPWVILTGLVWAGIIAAGVVFERIKNPID